ncbi:MAG: FtsX-like permease family protein [Eggerthellaceae bacterium]|jgi:putative ABC transport system permease protein
MLAKLAVGNVRRSARDYTLYFITLALGAAVFYAFNTVSLQADFLDSNSSDMLKSIGDILSAVTVLLAVVMGFLMVYANNFLMRRRKQELGLYQVLGMRRGQVSAILALETLLVGIASFAAGIAAGVLLSQLLLFVTGGLFEATVSHYRFFFSVDALGMTAGCFAVIFAVMLLLNLVALRRVRLVDLMGARRANEKNRLRSLPVSLVLFAAGVAAVAAAYVRLTTDGFPGFAEGTTAEDFYLTTGLVVVGTVLLFFGLAGTVTALLQRSPRFWWRDLNAFTARQIASRVNTTCASLAVVSLVLFLALTSVTSGMAICTALNGQADRSAPVDATLSAVDLHGDLSDVDLVAAARTAGVDLNDAGTVAQVRVRQSKGLSGGAVTMPAMADATGAEAPAGYENSYASNPGLWVMSLSDFNAQRSLLGLEPVSLGKNEYLITSTMDSASDFYNKVLAAGYTFKGAGRTFHPAQATVVDDASAQLENSNNSTNTGMLILPDDVADKLPVYDVLVKVRYSGSTEAGDRVLSSLQSDGDTITVGSDAFQSAVEAQNADAVPFVDTRTAALSAGTGVTALIIYLALYIGFVLVVACAAIMAVQQLSSTSDSAGHYRTLHELGCPDRMIYRSVRTQSGLMFLAPLVVALAHSVCALAAVLKLVEIFGYVDLGQTAAFAVAIFIVAYGGYFAATYRAEHGMVRRAIARTRRAL